MNEVKEDLKREIGVFGLSANIVNIIVGAGIFVLPAILAEIMGAASIIAYLFFGFLLSLIMLCFAEAGSRVTTTGGGFAYVETAFGAYPGFLVAIFAITGCVMADAAISNALVNVLGHAFPVFKTDWVRILFLLAIFTGLAAINVVGVKQGMGLVKINTVAKLTPLLLLILIGFKHAAEQKTVYQQSLNRAALHRESGFIAQEVEESAMRTRFTFSGVDKPTNDKALYGLRYGVL